MSHSLMIKSVRIACNVRAECVTCSGQDSQLLPLGSVGQIPVEQQKERLHLCVEDLTPRLSREHRALATSAHLFLGWISDTADHPVELIPHGFGSNSRGRRLEILCAWCEPSR